jgi:hypothetical protein
VTSSVVSHNRAALRRLVAAAVISILAVSGAVSLQQPTEVRAPMTAQTALELGQLVAAETDDLVARKVDPGQTLPTLGLDEHVAPSCSTGDRHRVQALYVLRAGQPDDLAARRPLILNDLATVDDIFSVSAGKTGGDVRVRWVHEPAPDGSCVPTITTVTIPADSAADPSYAVSISGYARPDRKYLLLTETPFPCSGTLYFGDQYPNADHRDPAVNTGENRPGYSMLAPQCLGGDIVAHELAHNLGAVQSTAPSTTGAGHCTDEQDLMCYTDESGAPMREVCGPEYASLLDCNHDDYFHTNPPPGSYLDTSWNLARSQYLDRLPVDATQTPATVTMAASSTRNGVKVTGTVTTAPPTSSSTDGTPVPVAPGGPVDVAGGTVQLEIAKPGTGRYRPLGPPTTLHDTTSANPAAGTPSTGRYTLKATVTSPGHIRVQFSGSQTTTAATSGTQPVTAPVWVEALRGKPTGRSRVLQVRVSDRDGRGVAGRPLRVQRSTGRGWRTVLTTTSRDGGARTAGSRTVKLSRARLGAGKVKVRVLTPAGGGYRSATSRVLQLPRLSR